MSTCSCGGCGCSSCQPAAGIFLSECPDPGTIAQGFHLSLLDSKFCYRRATNTPGLLQSVLTGGSYQITFTNLPQVELEDVNAVANTAFGQLIVMGSDFKWRALAPPVTANLFLKTNASGDIVLGSAPVATVPDPLSVTTLNVLGTATIEDLAINNGLTLSGVSSGTVTSLLGINASNQVVTQALSQSIAASMFYESASSPTAAAPNESKVSGDYLIIGNRLYDSGSSLINVTTSESITVAVAGKYLLLWVAQTWTSGTASVGAFLEINGVIVNEGNGRTQSPVGITAGASMFQMTGVELRTLAVGDVLKLQFSQLGGTAQRKTFGVRLIAVKFAD